MYKTNNCGTLERSFVSKSVTLAGWLHKRRDHGGLIFIDLRDASGLVQLAIDPKFAKKAHEVAETARGEWVLQVKGKVRLRPEESVNKNLKTGEIEVAVEELVVLSESLTPPFEIEDELEVNEEVRLQYRFLDLRRQKMYSNLKLRHDVSKTIWDYLSKEGFLQVETPLLLKSTPEGARDYVVPSRVNPGKFYALPQSPQQLKQILMVSGVERYFQLARCLRDEDLRADRQPEHTQLDLEMSWVHRDDVMDLVEGLYSHICKTTKPEMSISPKFKRMSYEESVAKYGTDKPDLRFGLELCDLSKAAISSKANLFSEGLSSEGIVKGFSTKGGSGLKRRELDALVEHAKAHGAGGLIWVVYDEKAKLGPNSSDISVDDYKTSLPRFITPEVALQMAQTCGANGGDLLLLVSGTKKRSYPALAALRNLVAKKMQLFSEKELSFVWIVDFPMFEWDDESNSFTPAHHLFTMPKKEDLDKLESSPGEVRAELFDLVCNGVELGSGSIRINKRDLQNKVFNVVGYTNEQVDMLFGQLLTAFDYGAPPHGGMGLGLDRLVAMLANESSIREVISFPKTQKGIDPLFRAPDVVSKEQLDELGISFKKA